jgi:hypothetical protein
MRKYWTKLADFILEHSGCRLPAVQRTLDEYAPQTQMETLGEAVMDSLLPRISQSIISFAAAGCLEFFEPL